MKKISVAIIGNPNSGKTTLFNALTGEKQHVANYPGVTIEKKEGYCEYKNTNIHLIDLPGIYSLTTSSQEEIITRNYLLHSKPDIIVNVLDAGNLERNLYLYTQIMELNLPTLLVFNMSDEAKAKGIEFDLSALSQLLAAPIVETIASQKQGIPELLYSIIRLYNKENSPYISHINYGKHIDHELKHLELSLAQDKTLLSLYPKKWLAIKLLEQDKEIFQQIKNPKIIQKAQQAITKLTILFGEHPQILLADRRYGFISGACQEAVRNTLVSRQLFSDKLDLIFTNHFLGLPIFFFFMYLVFHLTFSLGNPLVAILEKSLENLGFFILNYWPDSFYPLLRSLLIEGIISGVGGVLVFLPNIILLFLAIALLEGTGYLSRAAFLMDRFMHKIGLHGKSFIPLLLGIGCSVPAIMSTRILENKRDRITTILIIPLVSCGARLPIYTLLAPVFFPKTWQAPMVMLLYLIGIGLALITAKFLRNTLLKGGSTPLVMELPPYRIPTLKSLFMNAWENSWLYLKKAGTFILAFSILFWILTSFPKKEESTPNLITSTTIQQQAIQDSEALSFSWAGRLGHALEPVLKPLGFDWKIGTALISAFAAKELFVSQMSIVYAVANTKTSITSLRKKLKKNYTPLIAFCIMLFCLISTPCMATFAVTRQETGSWGWAFLQIGLLTLLAYLLTFIVYQTGSLLGW